MNLFLKTTLFAVIYLASMLCVGASAVQPPPKEQKLTVISTASLKTLHPFQSGINQLNYSHFFVTRPLLIIDRAGNWKCELCKTIPSFENGSIEIVEEHKVSKLVTTWEIQKNAKWGDGTPVTGKDVKFTWDIINQLINEKPTYSPFDFIEEIFVDKKQPKKFKIKFLGTNVDFFKLENFILLPSRLEEPVWKNSNGNLQAYFGTSLYNTAPANAGLYNGPFLVSSFSATKRVSMVLNPHFYKPAAFFKEIAVVIETNPAVAEKLLLGEKNALLPDFSLPQTESFNLIQKIFEKKGAGPESRFALAFGASGKFEHLDINMRNPLLSDISVRQALLFGTDRKSISEEVFSPLKDFGSAISAVKTQNYYFNKTLDYKFDPKKSAELLQSAGWTKNVDDGFFYKGGRKLGLTVVVPGENKTRQLIAKELVRQWNEIGVELNILTVSNSQFVTDVVPKAKFSDLVMFAWQLNPGVFPRSLFHSREVPSYENGYVGQNVGSWRNQNVDKWIEDLVSEDDPTQRESFISQIMDEYSKEAPAIPIFFYLTCAIVPANLENFVLSGSSMPSSLWVEEWKIK